MKKTKFKTLIVLSFFFLIFACKKSSGSDPNNTYSIKDVSGDYSGGTLTWQNVGVVTSSGTDPNFKIHVDYIDPDKVTLTLQTVSPIPSTKIFSLKLDTKSEANKIGYYGFSDTISYSQNEFEYVSSTFFVDYNNLIQDNLTFTYTKSQAFSYIGSTGILYK